jgi:hypothetical protein
LYLSIAAVKSGSSLSTVSPRVKVARRPGLPLNVLMGIRVRIASRTSNSAGSLIMGSSRGRNPRVVETMKAGRVVSSGFVSLRTLNEREGPSEPILESKKSLGRRGWEDAESAEEDETKDFGGNGLIFCFYGLMCVAGMKSGLSRG